MKNQRSVWPLPSRILSRPHQIGVFAAFNPALILAGLWVLYCHLTPFTPPQPPVDLTRALRVTGWILTPPEVIDEALHFTLRPLQVRQQNQPVDFREDLQVYIRSSTLPPDEFFQPHLSYGEILEFPGSLSLPHTYGVPGTLDAREMAWAKGTYFRVELKSPYLVNRRGTCNSLRAWLLRPVFRYLESFQAAAFACLPPRVHRLVMSALLGRQGTLTRDERRQMREMQIQHLFVVSGFHVGLVLACAHWLVRLVGLRGIGLPLSLAWVYIAAVGFPVPSVRAGILATLFCLQFRLALTSSLVNNLGISALMILAFTPEAARLPGFHFSYICLLAIAAFVVPAAHRIAAARRGIAEAFSDRVNTRFTPEAAAYRRWRFAWEETTRFLHRGRWFRLTPVATRLIGYLALLGVCTVSIQLTLFPVMLYYANQWNPAQAVNNLLLVPAFSLFMPAALTLLGLYWTPLAPLAATVTATSGRFCATLIDRLDLLAAARFVPQPSALETALYYALLLAAWLLLPRRWQGLLLLFPLLLLAHLHSPVTTPPEPRLVITLLDIGQGDCIHLRYPDGSHGMIDTGPASPFETDSYIAQRVIARYLWRWRPPHLSFLLLTHPEADHIGGFPFIWKHFRPNYLAYFRGSSAYREPAFPHQAGAQFEQGGVTHRILHPRFADGPRWETNDSSLVLRLDYGAFSMLCTGDISRKGERRLVDRLSPVTVLKVAHHGSRTSSSLPFLQAAAPRLALVSVGRDNRFGHPSPEVLERFHALGIPLLSTQRSGSLRLETDGRSLEVSAFSPEVRHFEPLFQWDLAPPGPPFTPDRITSK